MQLVNIKASKTPNQVWLTFSDHSFLPFFIDDVVKLSLTKNQEIDDQKLEEIIKSCLFFKGREYALRQIAISPKIEKIIYQKLKIFFPKICFKYQIKYPNINQVIEEIIDYLNSKSLLDPESFTNYFIQKNKNKSRQQISFLLSRYGLKSTLPNNDLELIKKIIQKKSNMDKLKLKALLYRRGFNLSDINAAIDDYFNFR